MATSHVSQVDGKCPCSHNKHMAMDRDEQCFQKEDREYLGMVMQATANWHSGCGLTFLTIGQRNFKTDNLYTHISHFIGHLT